jgi:hypothetical protein
VTSTKFHFGAVFLALLLCQNTKTRPRRRLHNLISAATPTRMEGYTSVCAQYPSTHFVGHWCSGRDGSMPSTVRFIYTTPSYYHEGNKRHRSSPEHPGRELIFVFPLSSVTSHFLRGEDITTKCGPRANSRSLSSSGTLDKLQTHLWILPVMVTASNTLPV